jgi:hypothetical protein
VKKIYAQQYEKLPQLLALIFSTLIFGQNQSNDPAVI